jgi:hypothetical protein
MHAPMSSWRAKADFMSGAVRSAIGAAACGCALLVMAASAFAQSTSGGWQAADGGAVDPSYSGVIDTPANGASVGSSGPLAVRGWFVDTTAQGWPGASDVQVYLGTRDTGTLVAHGQVGGYRPDVAVSLGNPYWESSGWSASLDPSQLAPGQNVLSVYVQTPAKGWFFQQVTVSTSGGSGEILAPAPGAQGPPPRVAILTPGEGESISTSNRGYTISGTASDPTNGAHGIDWVELWLNGEANTDNAIHLGDANLAGDGSWSLIIDAKQFAPINSNLYAYAHSATNGKRTMTVVHFYFTDRH